MKSIKFIIPTIIIGLLSACGGGSNNSISGTGTIDAYQAVINSKTTLLTLDESKPVNKSEHGQTLYKFQYLDKDGYSGIREYNVNFRHIAGRTNLYIKKNGIPDPSNNNSYDCSVLLDGRNEVDNEDSVNACLQEISLVYGDLLYIATKASGVSNGDNVGNIIITRTYPAVWGGNIDVGQGPLYYLMNVAHGDGDLKSKFTLVDVIGTVTIKVYGILDPSRRFKTLATHEQCTANEQGICSIETITQNGDKIYLQVDNTGDKGASYKIAIEGESIFVQTGSVTIIRGYDNSSDWWSYTHKNPIYAGDGSRYAEIVLSNFTDVNNNRINADLDLYTKKYQTDADISNNDISKTNYDCRPYYGNGTIETCKAIFDRNRKDNINERVRVRVRGYYFSNNEDKIVKFKLTTKASTRTQYE